MAGMVACSRCKDTGQMGRIGGIVGLGLFKKPCDECNISFRLAIDNAGPGKLYDAYCRAPEEMRDEAKLAIATLGKDGRCAEHVSERLKADKAFWSQAVSGSSVYALVPLFQHSPAEIRGDTDLALAAIARAAGCAKHVSAELAAEREFWRRAIAAAPCSYQFAPDDVRGDRDVAVAAVGVCGSCAAYVPAPLAADRGFWSSVIESADRSNVDDMFRLIPEDARDDVDVTLAAMKKHWGCVKHLSDRLRPDKAFWKRAVEECDAGDAYIIFHDAPEEVRDDPEMALAAIAKSGSCAEHLSPRLVADTAFWMRAIELSEWVTVCDILRDAPDAVRDDPEIALAGVAKIGYCAKFVSGKLRADKAFWLRAIPLMGEDWRAEGLTHAEGDLGEDPDLLRLCGQLSRDDFEAGEAYPG